MPSNAGRAGPIIFLGVEIAFLIVSRAIFWTGHPTNFDFANFALGVDRFAPFYHQPHPPGYPLVILMAKGFAALGASAVRALELTALVGSVLAVLGGYRLGKRLAGEAGGLLASSLLAIEPVFWYSAVSSPTRVYSAAGVCWVLYWLLELAEGRKQSVWAAAGALAVFGGFRPELLLLLAPAFVVAARRAGLRWVTVLEGLAACALLCLPWVLWTARTFGSPFRMAYVYYYYFLHHVSTTSALLGAPHSSSQRMLRDAILWNALPAVLAAVAFAVSRKRAKLERSFLIVAGAYIVPALAVQLLLHEGPAAPDHSLGTITVFCVVAGSLLGASLAGWVAAVAAVAMLSISFSRPGALPPELDLLSLRSFARSQNAQAGLINRLKQALRPGDPILVLNDSPVTWRILEYEFPENVVFALQATVQQTPSESGLGWRIFERRLTPLMEGNIPLAGAERLYVVSDPEGPQRKLVLERLCSQFACKPGDAELRVDLKAAGAMHPTGRQAGDSASLPPYTLRFVGG